MDHTRHDGTHFAKTTWIWAGKILTLVRVLDLFWKIVKARGFSTKQLFMGPVSQGLRLILQLISMVKSHTNVKIDLKFLRNRVKEYKMLNASLF